MHDITFEAKPGETTAIIGSTGSGKSTLVNLIPRFYDVTGGAITLDGMDIREIAQHELREKLGYVPVSYTHLVCDILFEYGSRRIGIAPLGRVAMLSHKNSCLFI